MENNFKINLMTIILGFVMIADGLLCVVSLGFSRPIWTLEIEEIYYNFIKAEKEKQL